MSLTKVSYAMINGEFVNVLDYGADSTGTDDSTSAIQAALDTGTSVYIPKGTYKITSSLQLSTNGQIVQGAGRILTILNWAGSTSDVVIENKDTTVRARITLKDFTIYANANGMTAIDFSYYDYSTIENLDIMVNGSNTVGIKLQGQALGTGPYYNRFTQIDMANNNVFGVTSGSIAWYLKRSATSEPGNYNGPNANQWNSGRISGFDKAFYCEDAIGNTFTGVITESIVTNHFEFGVTTPYYPSSNGAAIASATVNTLVDNSSLSCTANQFVNGTIYIYSGTGAGQYRQITSNGVNGNPFTVFPYWDVVPDSSSTYQLFNEAGGGNTIMGCYAEGHAPTAPTWLKLNPGVVSTYCYGGLLTSIGKIVDDPAPKVQNRLNPSGWADPMPFTFSLEDVADSLTGQALSPVGWLRNNFSYPGYWHIESIDIACNGAITSGEIKVWVTSNGVKINTDPDVHITSTSTYNTLGGSVGQRLYSSTAIKGSSLESQLGVVIDTVSLLPAGSLDLYLTLYVVNES